MGSTETGLFRLDHSLARRSPSIKAAGDRGDVEIAHALHGLSCQGGASAGFAVSIPFKSRPDRAGVPLSLNSSTAPGRCPLQIHRPRAHRSAHRLVVWRLVHRSKTAHG